MSKFLTKIKEACDFNSSNLSGCVDVIVVEDDYGIFHYTPFHVRISKMKMLHPKLKQISIFINNEPTKYKMSVEGDGTGFFEVPADYVDYDNPLPPAEIRFNPQTNKRNSLTIFNEDSVGTRSKSFNVFERLSTKESMESFQANPFLGQKRLSANNYLHQNLMNKIRFLLDQNDRVRVSLCGHLIQKQDPPEFITHTFEQHMIVFKKADGNFDELINDERIMFKIDDEIFDYSSGVSQLLSVFAFNDEIAEPKPQVIQEETDDRKYRLQKKVSFSRKTVKSLKPPQDFFHGIKLFLGLNTMEYRFKGNFGKTYTSKCRLFFYPHSLQHRVIVSDIDGTITKSDVLGHLMPIISVDWAHDGIAELFNNLSKRGYHIIYLTARNIGMYKRTLKYLKSINQKGHILPEGPIILSPDTLYESLKRELIVKTPHVFKIKVLQQINSVFCPGATYIPLYSGFGNKETDAKAYIEVGVPRRRIFTINTDGQIFVLKTGEVCSYIHLHENVNDVFPEFDRNQRPKLKSKITCFERPPQYLF